MEQATGLFYGWMDEEDEPQIMLWPKQYRDRYARAKTALERAAYRLVGGNRRLKDSA
jgi:hypothetical protein